MRDFGLFFNFNFTENDLVTIMQIKENLYIIDTYEIFRHDLYNTLNTSFCMFVPDKTVELLTKVLQKNEVDNLSILTETYSLVSSFFLRNNLMKKAITLNYDTRCFILLEEFDLYARTNNLNASLNIDQLHEKLKKTNKVIKMSLLNNIQKEQKLEQDNISYGLWTAEEVEALIHSSYEEGVQEMKNSYYCLKKPFKPKKEENNQITLFVQKRQKDLDNEV